MDAKLLYCEDQAIAATGDSDVIDFDVADPNIGAGEQMRFVGTCGENFNNATSIEFQLLHSDDNSTFVATGIDKTVLLADLVVGDPILDIGLPAKFKQYSKVHWILVGTAPSAGKITFRLDDGAGAGY